MQDHVVIHICFARCAISGVQAMAALTSLCLFAVIATPLADPHIKIPSSASFNDTSFATVCAKSG